MSTAPMEPEEVRAHVVEVILKTKPKLTKAAIIALVDAMIDGLRRRGIAIVDEDDIISPADEHLQTLKGIRRTLREAVADTDSKRDLASLTRRLQDVSREVTIIEERHRAERAERRSRNGSNSRTAASAGGQVDI